MILPFLLMSQPLQNPEQQIKIPPCQRDTLLLLHSVYIQYIGSHGDNIQSRDLMGQNAALQTRMDSSLVITLLFQSFQNICP